MKSASLRPAPFLSLRHAQPGRLDAGGRLPPGWRCEHLAGLEVLEIDFQDGKPSAVIRLELADAQAGWGGLTLATHLTAPKAAVVALAGQASLAAWTNVGEAMFALREWRASGEFLRQQAHALHIAEEPQISTVALEVGDDGHLVQPVLMVGRNDAALAASVIVTLTGLAFGALHDHPRWLWT